MNRFKRYLTNKLGVNDGYSITTLLLYYWVHLMGKIDAYTYKFRFWVNQVSKKRAWLFNRALLVKHIQSNLIFIIKTKRL